MNISPINFKDKFALISERWSPKIIAQMNDYHFKIAKIQGEFVWHCHPDTDETFIVIQGEMNIELCEGIIKLKAGEMCVIPKNIEHRPVATQECQILMVELAGTVNTGDVENDLTIQDTAWI
jgi:mannose-6-phosphate isomerase-like protein (cupin superfamily)